MRVPVSWLREYVAVDATPEELAERLVLAGFEVDAIIRRGAPDTGGNHGAFRIGRVVHFEKHPNADRLRLCRVDVGEAEPRQIVCGAANFREGDTVVVAVPGALLPGADAPLRQAKLRGLVSDGMMLSERELQLSDEHDGIIVLPDAPPPGTLLADLVALEEAILDLSIESNRGDCLSVYGIAREVGAIFDLDVAPLPDAEPPVDATRSTGDVLRIEIAAPARCLRFTGRAFRDVRVGPSPLLLRQRLSAAGMRPISNVVDITNYVMHALGQPTHAYDARDVADGVLEARLARADERIRTLDGRERALRPDDLVIADGRGPQGIAGVMGAEGSEIRPDTTEVLLEAACFERSGILRTSHALGLRTDASSRFEKGVDPGLAPVASRYCAQLLVALAGATQLSGPLDVQGDLPAPRTARLRRAQVPRVLGLDVPDAEVERILGRLGFAPERAADGWTTSVPSWRALDATREADLVEEVGRIHGLDRIEPTLPARRAAAGGLDRGQAMRRRVEQALVGAGVHEAVTITLVEEDEVDRYGLAADDPRREHVHLRNPLTAELAVPRTTLVPSLLSAAVRNRSVGRWDVALFEIAHVFRPVAGERLPHEPWTLAAVVAGSLGGSGWTGPGQPADVFLAKGLVGAVLDRIGVPWRVERLVAPHLHPGRAARLLVGSGDAAEPAGELGELHPAVAARFDLDGPVAVLEVDLDVVERHLPAARLFSAVPEQPPVRQDIAVVVGPDVEAEALVSTALEVGAPLLRSAEVFDVYRDAARLGDRASIAIHLSFQADDRTLTEDEASAVRAEVVAALGARHGAELRG